MSDFAAKNYGGLMEAYASIYKQPDQVIEEQVDQEICFEDVEVDSDLMVDIIIDRLVAEGYASTDDQALNMIPYMSDVWLDTVVGNFVIEQNFIEAVNSILEEGYDLSSYTVDELYEEYVGHFNQCINEQLSLQEAIPLVAAPLAGPAIAAGLTGLVGGAAKLYQGMQRKGTDPASQRWLETGSYASKKQTPKQQRNTAQQRRQQAAERLKASQQAKQQQPAPQAQPAKPAAGGAPPAGPTPPKPPKGPGPLSKAKDLLKQGLGLQPNQSIGRELAKKTIVKTGQAIKGTPGAVKGFFTSPKPAVRALKALGVAELGSFAGRMGKSPTGEVLKGAGSLLKGLGGAAQQAPKEAGAIQQGVSAYQQAKEQKPKPKPPVKKPESLPGFE
jgi:hypothetical protein